ncbi:PIN domain nuclease [Caminibacter profundus]
MNKIYFDTNIIIDLLDSKRMTHKDSLKLLNFYVNDNNTELFINSDSLTNIFYILRHRVKLSFLDSIEKIENIKDMFEIVSIEKNEIEFAIEICKNNEFKDFEDALQYICALKADCEMIVTNNIKDFRFSSIDVFSPKELIKKLNLW